MTTDNFMIEMYEDSREIPDDLSTTMKLIMGEFLERGYEVRWLGGECLAFDNHSPFGNSRNEIWVETTDTLIVFSVKLHNITYDLCDPQFNIITIINAWILIHAGRGMWAADDLDVQRAEQ